MPADRVFFSASGVEMGADRRAVEEDLFQIRVTTDGGKHPFPHAGLVPARKPHVRGVPVPEFRRQIAPRSARPKHPQHGVDEQPIVPCGDAPITGFSGQQRLNPFPLVMSQNPSGHSSNSLNELEQYSTPNCEQALTPLTRQDLTLSRRDERPEPTACILHHTV